MNRFHEVEFNQHARSLWKNLDARGGDPEKWIQLPIRCVLWFVELSSNKAFLKVIYQDMVGWIWIPGIDKAYPFCPEKESWEIYTNQIKRHNPHTGIHWLEGWSTP